MLILRCVAHRMGTPAGLAVRRGNDSAGNLSASDAGPRLMTQSLVAEQGNHVLGGKVRGGASAQPLGHALSKARMFRALAGPPDVPIFRRFELVAHPTRPYAASGRTMRVCQDSGSSGVGSVRYTSHITSPCRSPCSPIHAIARP